MSEKQTIYEFSDFRVDVKNNLLKHHGKAVSITPKVFETLVLLLENAGNLVEKDEMMSKIWNDRFVEESNLTFNIKMLRKALKDDAANPIFIETVPRKGYRFIAKLRDSNVIKHSSKLPDEILETPKNTKQKYLVAGALALILIGLVTAYAIFRRNADSNQTILTKEFSSIKLTDTGKSFHPTISPDGKFIAYISESNKKQSLWLRQLSNGQNTQILSANTDMYYGLAFSPDGENLYFASKPLDGVISIYRIAMLGGVPTKIVERSEGGISISPDGKKICFVRYDKGNSKQNKLMMVDADGKNERLIKQSDSGQVFHTHTFAPDGKRITISYGHSDNASKEISLTEIYVESGEQKEFIKEKFFSIRNLVWLPNQNSLLMTASESLGDVSRIWEIDARTRKIKPISHDSTSYSKISIPKNADSIVTETITADFRLFTGETANPSNIEYLTQARDGFAFAPDGKIVYASDASGNEDIWIMDADGTNQKQLTGEVSIDAYPIVSPDNLFIYFSSNRNGKYEIWRMNIDGSNQTKISQNASGVPRFVTPDGKWVYFENSLTQIVWKAASDGSDEQPLFSDKLGYFHAFSPDGMQMAFLKKDKETSKFMLSVISLENKQIIKTYQLPNNKTPYFLNWTADGKFLNYLMMSDNEGIVWIQDVTKESPTELSKLGNESVLDCRLNANISKFGFIRGNWKHDVVLLKSLQ
ncbi:MAG: winged helix-turn-helix domain-containing protein [Acidobacteriota bacterium]